MTKARYISAPLHDLLEVASLTAPQIDEALDSHAARWATPMLRPGHPHLKMINEKTGVNVIGIARRYRRLLLEISEMGDSSQPWRYWERGRTDCKFGIKVVLGETIKIDLLGRTVGDLFNRVPLLAHLRIDAVDQRDEWLDLSTAPEWHAF